MFYVSHESASGKAHARFSRYSTNSDDIPPDGEADAGTTGDIPFTDARQFIEKYGPLVERPMILWAIVSLAENNKRRGHGLYAYPSYQFLAERLYGDPSPRGAGRIKRHMPYFKKLGLLVVTRRRPSKDKSPQTNLYTPTRKCFEFIEQFVAFAVNGVFLGGNAARDEKAPLVFKEEYKERASLVDENRLLSAQEQDNEQATPPVSATTDTGEQERENGGEEKDTREVTANAERLDVIRKTLSLSPSTPYQASSAQTQVAKLAGLYPDRTKLLPVRVRQAERDGASQSIILEALAVTEAKNPGDYAAYFTATCAKLKHAEDESEAARQRGVASQEARDRQRAEWKQEASRRKKIDLQGMIREGLARRHEREAMEAMQAESVSP